MEGIVNKVEQSGLLEINLEDYYSEGTRSLIDLKSCLFQGLILKEKDFRAFVRNEHWEKYKDHFVAITCSAEAIIPTWAYMLVAASLKGIARKVIYGDLQTLETVLFLDTFSKFDVEKYRDKKILIRGCGHLPVPESAYVEITNLLTPVAKSVMFGEACGTVPVYKQ